MEAGACTELGSRVKFSDYIHLLRNATNNDFSLVRTCRSNICSALWGSENPDISGDGMAVGYLMESFIVVVIIGLHVWYITKHRKHAPVATLLLSNATRTYGDTSLFFNFAIQVACIVTVTRADWDMGADGMGGITKEVSWLVSSLALLPLVVLFLRPHLFKEWPSVLTNKQIVHGLHNDVPTVENERGLHKRWNGESPALATAREEQRLWSFVICWALAFGPFFSRMGGTFGVSKIGSSSEAVISESDWAVIEQICFEGVEAMPSSQKNLITAVGIISYFLVTFAVLLKIFASPPTPNDHQEDTKPWIRRLKFWVNEIDAIFDKSSITGLVSWLITSGMVIILLVIEFWAFFRLRSLQGDMVRAASGNLPDPKWAFGQIVAIAIFLPVMTEVIFVWRKRVFFLNAEGDVSIALSSRTNIPGKDVVKGEEGRS